MANDLVKFDTEWPEGHVTTDGRQARFLGEVYGRFKKLAFVIGDYRSEQVELFMPDGRKNNNGKPSPLDLKNYYTPLDRWFNVYLREVRGPYLNEQDANANANPDRLSCRKVTFEIA